MTYRQLFEHLQKLSEEQLNMDVTISDCDDEYYPIDGIAFTSEACDVLDENHPVLYLGAPS